MTARRNVTILAGTVVLAFAAPAAAHAATKTVRAGLPPSAAKPFQKLASDVNDFFPHGVTIRVGDSVRFVNTGFHTVDLPPRGGAIVPLLAPSGQSVAGALDAGGAPFWFNGQPALGFNPLLLSATWGQSATYDARSRVESGLPLGPSGPLTVRFARKGSFTYLCDVHPGMKGVVHVVARHARAPSRRADARAVRRQVARDLAIARRLRKAKAPANTVDVGVAGAHGVERFALLPATLRVRQGTTVRFRMSPRSVEAHTATTGPGPAEDQTSYLGKLAASFERPAPDPLAVYPSEAPGSTGSLTPALHGNGFWNSGAMDTAQASPLPARSAVTFAAPGTYQFYCLIHPFMHGTVVVQ